MDYKEIKRLIEDMGESKIDSLDIEFPDGTKLSMKKNQTLVTGVAQEVKPLAQVNVNTNAKNETNIDTEAEENLKEVKSPMVGTFYTSPSPNAEPFVKKGDHVKKGQVLCVVEAMKLMNEIESEFDGEIVEVCVKNEDMVEYGTPLFKIKE